MQDMIGCLADWPLSGWLLASQSRSDHSSCLSLVYILCKIWVFLQISNEDAEQTLHCSLRRGLAIIVQTLSVLFKTRGCSTAHPLYHLNLLQTPSKHHLRFGSKRQLQQSARACFNYICKDSGLSWLVKLSGWLAGWLSIQGSIFLTAPKRES